MVNNSEDLLKTLAAIERAESDYLAELNRKCDWDDPNDVAQYRKEERMRVRNEILARVAPTRKCPVCQQLKLDSVGWVISANCRKAMCRSCYFRKWPEVVVNTPARLFAEERRFAVDGTAIKSLREKIGCSVREFCRRAGWSRAYQRKIEAGEIRTVGDDTASVMLTVFKELGVTTRDCT